MMAAAKESEMDFNGQRVLVTGGAGFLGANLCHALAARGAKVTALDGFLFGGGANPANLEGAGVELVRGWGRFLGPNTIGVTAADGGERELEAERILIAVGGRPHRPEIPGAHLAWVSDDLFELETLPEEMVVIILLLMCSM